MSTVAPVPMPPLPPQPEGVPWPTDEWPEAAAPSGADLAPLLDAVFDESGPLAQTYAVVVVHHGTIVAERYAGVLEHWGGEPEPVERTTRLRSWSMAKSMLHATVGLLVGDGLLDPAARAGVAAWSDPADPRQAITLEQLLAMRDGLRWAEDYVDAGVSDVIEMLFGSGASDVAAFAAARPLAAEPGTVFNYSSGTSNVIAAIVRDLVGPGDAMQAFLYDRLFEPIGMRSAVPGLDDAGTWVASSYVHATARDFARFGFLYLRDGIWDGRRILPAGWVDHARLLRSVDPDDGKGYGAQWWITGDEHGSFWANGYEGQSVLVSPGLDLVVVRLGRTDASHSRDLFAWRRAVVEAIAAT
jgi:CubicO group peptidase (beta-lactamase class C family)